MHRIQNLGDTDSQALTLYLPDPKSECVLKSCTLGTPLLRRHPWEKHQQEITTAPSTSPPNWLNKEEDSVTGSQHSESPGGDPEPWRSCPSSTDSIWSHRGNTGSTRGSTWSKRGKKCWLLPPSEPSVGWPLQESSWYCKFRKVACKDQSYVTRSRKGIGKQNLRANRQLVDYHRAVSFENQRCKWHLFYSIVTWGDWLVFLSRLDIWPYRYVFLHN